jgi:hypothetical protein
MPGEPYARVDSVEARQMLEADPEGSWEGGDVKKKEPERYKTKIEK